MLNDGAALPTDGRGHAKLIGEIIFRRDHTDRRIHEFRAQTASGDVVRDVRDIIVGGRGIELGLGRVVIDDLDRMAPGFDQGLMRQFFGGGAATRYATDNEKNFLRTDGWHRGSTARADMNRREFFTRTGKQCFTVEKQCRRIGYRVVVDELIRAETQTTERRVAIHC